MLRVLLPSLFAAPAGASIVVQQVINANLRNALNSAAWSGFMSYLVGLACMTGLVVLFRDPVPPANVALRIPWWAWSGGLFGAVFIGSAILLVPRLGAAAFIALLVAGQMVTAVLVDHVGWLGLAQRPVDLPRLAGILMLVGGVVLIRR